MKHAASLILAIACSTLSLPARAVDVSFDTEIQHSKAWHDWADCGDFPGLSSAPENVHMAWHGTLSFDPPEREGWFTTTSFQLLSNRTGSGTDFKAYVSGFYAPGGYVTLYVDFAPGHDYADSVLTLQLAQPVPEPAPLALLAGGLLAIGAAVRRRA